MVLGWVRSLLTRPRTRQRFRGLPASRCRDPRSAPRAGFRGAGRLRRCSVPTFAGPVRALPHQRLWVGGRALRRPTRPQRRSLIPGCPPTRRAALAGSGPWQGDRHRTTRAGHPWGGSFGHRVPDDDVVPAGSVAGFDHRTGTPEAAHELGLIGRVTVAHARTFRASDRRSGSSAPLRWAASRSPGRRPRCA